MTMRKLTAFTAKQLRFLACLYRVHGLRVQSGSMLTGGGAALSAIRGIESRAEFDAIFSRPARG